MWKNAWNVINAVVMILTFIVSIIHFVQGNLSAGFWALAAVSWQLSYTLEKNIK